MSRAKSKGDARQQAEQHLQRGRFTAEQRRRLAAPVAGQMALEFPQPRDGEAEAGEVAR